LRDTRGLADGRWLVVEILYNNNETNSSHHKIRDTLNRIF